MQVTEIKVFPVDEEKLRAFVSIVIDRCFMVNDIKVINGRDGLFISMPSRRKKNGKFKDVAHPLNNETRQMIEGMILTEYQQALDERAMVTDQLPEAPPAPQEAPVVEMRDEPSDFAAPLAAAPVPEPLAAAPPAEPLAASSSADEPAEESKSLEEVTEMHLRDSFWTT